ncbi:MAG: hypothetical protein ACT4N5_05070 [Nitrosopumilaceae archaeon]
MERSEKNFLLKDFSSNMFLLFNLVISFGILLVAIGGGWDITNHLLNRPETFFSPPHALLYAGVAISLAGTLLVLSRWFKLPSEEKSKYRFFVKLGLAGIVTLITAGPFDFAWHANFGLDGLLSPPHLTLITGMFLCATASMISILRFGTPFRTGSYSIHHFIVVLALLPVWMVSSGFLYSFSLPFSQTNYFDFNPDIYFAAVFATISMPLLTSTILFLSSKFANYKFGILSSTGTLLLIINIANSIIPNPALIDTIPFYLMTIIPFVVSDVILAMCKKPLAAIAVGGILGSTFYFLYFPLITHVYNEVVYDKIVSGSATAHVYFEIMPLVFPVVIGPAVICGIIGIKFAEKIFWKIQRKNA